ncbi:MULTISPECIES: hypothetical protein [unclassified Rhodococcus (in: high G+C Gram-positive bacteria)]|uniref:hypothetical protein n=1 Tax=unclassified Rhodococcus (in: high G+C Gram-positive bacteria) TaxID=192944 RepID=UPI001FF87049|nr:MULTISPECIES: hypothetical protein [unclassified Rhodococcus (in: high G+C Gram-positive bacteria)]
MADDNQPSTEGSEPQVSSDAHKRAQDEVAGIDAKYEPGSRPTVVLPGTNGMVSGTAFADMVDDEGNLKEDHSEDTAGRTSTNGHQDE